LANIEFIVAGTAFEERAVYAELLHLGEELTLVNAIRLHLASGDVVGYVPRYIASELAFMLDHAAEQGGGVNLSARVFELLREPVTGDCRISVTIDLPDDWVIHLRSVSHENEADVRTYVFEQTQRASYVMLRCSAEQMLTVRAVLVGKGFAVDRSGFASRPASNGQRYAWFIRDSHATTKSSSASSIASSRCDVRRN
jgi:hypothetical protein